MSNGMRDAFRDVIEFEAACGVPPRTGPPAIPPMHKEVLHLRLLEEEFSETVDAVGSRDLAAIADGIADLIWVALVMAYQYGIDLPAVWCEVRRANMAKFGPGSHRREDGKLLKPPGWQPPDIIGVLSAQRPLAETYGDGPTADPKG